VGGNLTIGITQTDDRFVFQTNQSFQLHNITFSARIGDLIMIIGSIASGKVCEL